MENLLSVNYSPKESAINPNKIVLLETIIKHDNPERYCHCTIGYYKDEKQLNQIQYCYSEEQINKLNWTDNDTVLLNFIIETEGI